MTPEQEKAIRRREKKATKFEPDARYWEMPEFEDDAGSVYGSIGCQREEDLEFFLHARTDIPTLLAEVDRLRKEDARLREALVANRARKMPDGAYCWCDVVGGAAVFVIQRDGHDSNCLLAQLALAPPKQEEPR